MTATIERVESAVATLERVSVQLSWPADAPHGRLRLRAGRLDAPELGYGFRDIDWRCNLQRDGQGGWRCEGAVRGGDGTALQLSVALGTASTDVVLARGRARVELHRIAATPDATSIDLTQVPLAWMEAMLARAWDDARITGGTVGGRLLVTAANAQPLRIAGPVDLTDAALDTADGSIAAEGLNARFDIDARLGKEDAVIVDGHLDGGELLFGRTYVSLQQRPVALHVQARHAGEGTGWQFPSVSWADPGILSVAGSIGLTADATVDALELDFQSRDLAPLRDGYLSGWLGTAGMADLQLDGAAEAHVAMRGGALTDATLRLHDASFDDPRDRFGFAGLDGSLRFSSSDEVTSALTWRSGVLYGLPFGAAQVPLGSSDGVLRIRSPLSLPILGGIARLEQLAIRPPAGGKPLDIRFGLALDQLDVARLSAALDWPQFTGELSGRIPEARYADDRLVFDGGLTMQLFGGTVSVSELAMERPFGTAPTLSADVVLDDIGLKALTGAFDFGGITGALDGRIHGLRLVDWQPVAFDAQLRTDRKRGVRQRISQRAVQDLSSVGDASFVTSLQSQLLGIFDDFGYSQIGIGCRLLDEVCTMSGLGSAGRGFTIVRGSGLPRLTVVGFNRQVDWPMLIERLTAVGSGDVRPVVE
ncbi:MAG: YdbH domain-containing protein [Pseudomonadota bacterium]|nr:YdbH domain-containing protein [Pseudomonadota bacterium]